MGRGKGGVGEGEERREDGVGVKLHPRTNSCKLYTKLSNNYSIVFLLVSLVTAN